MSGYTVEVTNLSPVATERDLYEFFAFSGAIEHIEIIRSGDYASTAYVTFKEPYSLETAVLLSGATIVDQSICIARWGPHDEASDFWDRPYWKLEDVNMSTTTNANHFTTTPGEALTVAQDVVKTMLAKGYTLSKDALIKAKALDESYQVSATAAAKVAELSKRIGLTDKINAGVDSVKSVDERYHVSETTKTVVSATATVVSATGRTAASVANSIVSSSYFSFGAQLVSDALTKAAKAAADLATYGDKK